MNNMMLVYRAKKEALIVLDELHLPYKVITDTMLQEKLGMLFELEGFEASHDKSEVQFDFPIMVIHGIEDDILSEMIEKLQVKNANIERKAMLTKHNQHWTMFALMEEIEKEHAYFQAYDRIVYLLKEANQLKKEDYAKDYWLAYQDAFMNAYVFIQQKKEDNTMMMKVLKNLEHTRQQLKKL